MLNCRGRPSQEISTELKTFASFTIDHYQKTSPTQRGLLGSFAAEEIIGLRLREGGCTCGQFEVSDRGYMEE
jgi:hypothetical protein